MRRAGAGRRARRRAKRWQRRLRPARRRRCWCGSCAAALCAGRSAVRARRATGPAQLQRRHRPQLHQRVGRQPAEGLPDAVARPTSPPPRPPSSATTTSSPPAAGRSCPRSQLRAGHDRPGRRRAAPAADGLRRSQGRVELSRTTSTSTLEKAVKRFQASNGLTPTGIVDKRTIAALNVPAEARLKQLKTNLARLHGAHQDRRQALRAGQYPRRPDRGRRERPVVSRHAGVVGKPDRPTPLLRSTIHRDELQSGLDAAADRDREGPDPARAATCSRRGQSVLVKFGIDAYDGNGKKLDPEKIDWSSAGRKQPALPASSPARRTRSAS